VKSRSGVSSTLDYIQSTQYICLFSFNRGNNTLKAQYAVLGIDIPVVFLHAKMLREYPVCRTEEYE